MDLKQWEIILAQSFDDSRLSDSEKVAINQWIAPHRTDEQALTLLRASLFQFAHEHAGSPDQTKLIEWLGKIVKLLLPLTQKEDHDPVVLFAPEDGVAERIAGLFYDAKETVSVCVFTITDNFLTDAILCAHNRGVLIRILTDNQKSSDDGSDISLLETAGIQVVRDQSEAHMHHKFALFDSIILVNGSYNWTRSAGKFNQENLVLSRDPRLIGPFQRYFERMWQKFGS